MIPAGKSGCNPNTISLSNKALSIQDGYNDPIFFQKEFLSNWDDASLALSMFLLHKK